MPDMIGRCYVLVAVASLILVGCSSERDRQWYKPASDYTVAEFQRERDECTKDHVLDEQCLKQKGWVPLTSDREPAASATTPAPPLGGRY
ncbi:MAG: hypothetical protein ACREKQ_11315 [Candidatus Rokuibacteriota bacterium]